MSTIKRRGKTSSTKTSTAADKANSAGNANAKKVMTGPCRSSFMRVLSLTPGTNGKKASCSTGIIIPFSDKKTVKAIKMAIQRAAKEKFGENIDIFKSQKLKNPLKNGNELLDDPETSMGEEVRDCYFLNAKSYRLPQIVNRQAKKIEDPDDLMEICVSGFQFRFSLFFTGYEATTEEGAKIRGVMCLLNNLMFVKADDRLDGGSDAEDDFAEFAEEGSDDDDDDEFDED